MASLTTEELMALAVLRGDRGAARALADSLLNEYQAGAGLVPQLRGVLPVGLGRLRVMLHMDDPDSVLSPGTDVAVRNWLVGEDGAPSIMGVTGIDRMEMWELPEGWQAPPGWQSSSGGE